MCAYLLACTFVNVLVLQGKTPPAQVEAGNDHNDCKRSICASWWKEKHASPAQVVQCQHHLGYKYKGACRMQQSSAGSTRVRSALRWCPDYMIYGNKLFKIHERRMTKCALCPCTIRVLSFKGKLWRRGWALTYWTRRTFHFVTEYFMGGKEWYLWTFKQAARLCNLKYSK